jgi:hypothetical protein
VSRLRKQAKRASRIKRRPPRCAGCGGPLGAGDAVLLMRARKGLRPGLLHLVHQPQSGAGWCHEAFVHEGPLTG